MPSGRVVRCADKAMEIALPSSLSSESSEIARCEGNNKLWGGIAEVMDGKWWKTLKVLNVLVWKMKSSNVFGSGLWEVECFSLFKAVFQCFHGKKYQNFEVLKMF
jgi:hypothetical protein